MKRLFLIFLITMLPLQMSWAVASSYCEHENGKAAQHLGHHEHKHQASGDKQPSKSKLGMVDADCGYCHHCCANIIATPHTSLPVPFAATQVAFEPHRYISPISDAPSRPNWRHAI
ncbi:MAG: cation efflux protein, CzcI family [Pseudomonadota bacterium]